MGGGEYERAATFDAELKPVVPIQMPGQITAALAGEGVVEIRDSGRYAETPVINAAAGKRVELRAANGARPTLVLGGEFAISGGAEAEVTLNGLLITGGALRVTGPLRRLRLRHCTLVPGPAPSLIVEATGVAVEIDHCILGGLRVADGATVVVRDSIIDATAEERRRLRRSSRPRPRQAAPARRRPDDHQQHDHRQGAGAADATGLQCHLSGPAGRGRRLAVPGACRSTAAGLRALQLRAGRLAHPAPPQVPTGGGRRCGPCAAAVHVAALRRPRLRPAQRRAAPRRFGPAPTTKRRWARSTTFTSPNGRPICACGWTNTCASVWKRGFSTHREVNHER